MADDTPVVIDVQDVTTLSKVIACNTNYYNDPERDKANDQYTLFIVNDGTVNGTPIVDIYYGNNKLSQIIVTKSLPYLGIVGKVYIKNEIVQDEDTVVRPAGIYLCQTEGVQGTKSSEYLCLTNLAETGNISSAAQELIVNSLYNKVSKSFTWKTL